MRESRRKIKAAQRAPSAGRPRTAMADVVGAAAEGEHKLDAGEIVPVINTEETKGRLLKSIMISSLEHGNPNQRFPQLRL